MPWFKVCDTFAFNDKTVAAGNAAIGLWVRAGSWCAQNRNDGVIPKHMVTALGGSAATARKLVNVGLWEPTSDGYRFVEGEGAQATRQEVEDDRAAARERMRRLRARNRRSAGARPAIRGEVHPNNAIPKERSEPVHETDLDRGAAYDTGDDISTPMPKSASAQVRALRSVNVRANSERTSQAVRSTLTRPCPTSSPSPPHAASTDEGGGGGSTRSHEPGGDRGSSDDSRAQAAVVVEALGPRWRIGRRALRRLEPEICAALGAGWTAESLAAHLRESPEGVRSPYAVLSARLADLPSPPALRPERPPWCGQCDEATRMREADDDHRPFRCPTCHPAGDRAVAARRPGDRSSGAA
ncbi:hypothetical protein HEB94_000602 [Actinopolymorpha pittospori]|uniref:Helix-turn-helix domain-containing protein n=1 Tax=Actinopolymorpha pittospori TaxID=648752 RepID=A0A927R718_9ACTN|nr:hypothetical protein [Actinopolymorpha pittospori]